jgi:hypothetical protein
MYIHYHYKKRQQQKLLISSVIAWGEVNKELKNPTFCLVIDHQKMATSFKDTYM